jgi:hypothetical protein
MSVTVRYEGIRVIGNWERFEGDGNFFEVTCDQAVTSVFGQIQFTGELIEVRFSVQNPNTSSLNALSQLEAVYRSPDGTINVIGLGNSCNFNPFAYFRSRRINFVRFNRINQNPPDPETTCRFRIFAADGSTVIDITREICPTATVIPERCELRKGEKEIISRYTKLGKYDNTRLEVETRGSCIDVYLKSGLVQVPFFKGIKVAEKCSDNGCPAPEFKIDCCKKRGCEDEKCPDGTYKRILVKGKTLQCVDKNGCVLKQIPYNPKCEKPDCYC